MSLNDKIGIIDARTFGQNQNCYGFTNPGFSNCGFNIPTFDWQRYLSAATSTSSATTTPDANKLEEQAKIARAIQERTLQTEEKKPESVAESTDKQLKAIEDKDKKMKDNHVGFWKYAWTAAKGAVKSVVNTFWDDKKGLKLGNIGTAAALAVVGWACPPVGIAMGVYFGGKALLGMAKNLGTMFSDDTTKQQRLDAAESFGGNTLAAGLSAVGVRSGIRLMGRTAAANEATVARNIAGNQTGGLYEAIRLQAGKLKTAAKSKNNETVIAERQSLESLTERNAQVRGEVATPNSNGVNQAAINKLDATLDGILKNKENPVDPALATKIENIRTRMASQDKAQQYSTAELETEITGVMSKLDNNFGPETGILNSALDQLAAKAPKTGLRGRLLGKSGNTAAEEIKLGLGDKIANKMMVTTHNLWKTAAIGSTVALAGGQSGTGIYDSVVNYADNERIAQTNADKQKVLEAQIEVAKKLTKDETKLAELESMKDDESVSLDDRIKKVKNEIEDVHKKYDEVFHTVLNLGETDTLSGKPVDEIRQQIDDAIATDRTYLAEHLKLTEDMKGDVATNPTLARRIKETAAKLRKEEDEKAKAEAKKREDAYRQQTAQWQTGFANPFARSLSSMTTDLG